MACVRMSPYVHGMEEDVEQMRIELRNVKERLLLLEAANANSRLKSVEERVNQLEDSKFKQEQAKDATPKAEDLTLQILVRDAEQECTGHKVVAKAWDAAMFIGTGVLGVIGSAFMFLIIFLNLFGQTLFLTIMVRSETSFLQSALPSIASLKSWRLNYGHDFAGEQHGHSLVSRVCGRDKGLSVSTKQAGVVTNANGYLDIGIGTALGPLLSMFCLTMWMLTMLTHFNEIGGFAISLVKLRAKKTSFKRLSDGALLIASITTRRCVVLLFLTLVRFVLSSSLLVIGSLWLAKTSKVEDLLKNAVSLKFVLALDELLFSSLATDTARRLVLKLKPLPGLKPRHWHGIGLRPVGFLFGCLLLMGIMRATTIEFTKAKMENMTEALCGGRQDFIVHVEPSSHRVTIVDTTPWSESAAHKLEPLEEMVDDLIRNPVRNIAEWWDQGADIDKAVSYANLPIDQYSALFDCKDGPIDAISNQIFKTISEEHIPSSNCADLKDLCWRPYFDVVRLLCPQTCGCDSPFAGWARHGCPHSCKLTEKYRSESSTLPCRDLSQGELRQNRYWSNMQRVSGLYGFTIEHCHNVTKQLCTPASMNLYPSFINFCPQSCGCEGGGDGCPFSCYIQDTNTT